MNKIVKNTLILTAITVVSGLLLGTDNKLVLLEKQNYNCFNECQKYKDGEI